MHDRYDSFKGFQGTELPCEVWDIVARNCFVEYIPHRPNLLLRWQRLIIKPLLCLFPLIRVSWHRCIATGIGEQVDSSQQWF